MAKTYEVPPGVDIASLKKRGKAAVDLMKPGSGTPWEDRGALGTVKAFVQTCIKSITSPAMLLDHIRRADTTGEARTFAFGCCAFWAVSAAVHMVIWNLTARPTWADRVEGYDTNFYIKTAIFSVAVAVGVFLLFVAFANRMYYSMIASELKNAAPRVLLYNMFCYCLGPSILAPIPYAGPPLALLLIFLAWCIGGGKRLYISWRGAIVGAVLTMVLALAMAAGGMFVINLVLNNVLGLTQPPEPEHDPNYIPMSGR